MAKKPKPEPTPAPWTAERIKAIRDRLGLTQTQLGEECGSTLRTVQYWEAGKPPSGAALKMLAVLEARANLSAAQR